MCSICVDTVAEFFRVALIISPLNPHWSFNALDRDGNANTMIVTMANLTGRASLIRAVRL